MAKTNDEVASQLEELAELIDTQDDYADAPILDVGDAMLLKEAASRLRGLND